MKILQARYFGKLLNFNQKCSQKLCYPYLCSLEHLKHSSNAVSDDDYQFLEASKLPMLHFQPSLPRLPIPPLEKTCQRYLASQKVLLSDEQFENTKQIVQQFQQNEGKNLHQQLVAFDKSNKKSSYITQMWFDMYLRSRDALPINFNPLIGLADDPNKPFNDQLIRSTNVLISSLRFMKSLKAKTIEPEVYHLNPTKSDTDTFRKIVRLVPSRFSWYAAFLFKAFPLDMSQYEGLFNATRVPKPDKDVIQRVNNSRHMLVFRNGNMYTFDALDVNGNIKDPKHIHACLAQILADKSLPTEFPLAALTTLPRNKWANIREKLLVDNSEKLNLVDSAIFSLTLDDEVSKDDPNVLVPRLLHGDGSNIWFDKSLTVMVMKDGKTALNFEHSWGDGVAVLRFINELFKDSTTKPRINPSTSLASIDPNSVKRIEFNLNSETKNDIKAALEAYDMITKNLRFDFNIRDGFGKKQIKIHKLSPDSVMQLSFQIAYLKYKNKTVASYESCSTAAFLHGRTETIRPATIATKQCAEAFLKKDRASNDEIKKMMAACSQIHGQLTKDAATGHGFDRHLFALKTLSEQNNQPLPNIFDDYAYKSINHNIISTSTLSSPACMFGAFGPVVKDGLGIGYVVNDEQLGTAISSYSAHSDGYRFSQCLMETWEEIIKILA